MSERMGLDLRGGDRNQLNLESRGHLHGRRSDGQSDDDCPGSGSHVTGVQQPPGATAQEMIELLREVRARWSLRDKLSDP
jgi:hypothetical protein